MPIFDFKDTVCINQEVELLNESEFSSNYQWDFCHNDLKNDLEYNLLGGLSGVNGGNAIKLAYDSSKWYGFVSSRNTNELFRLEFNDNLDQIESKVNLGNIGNKFSKPNSIEFLQEGGIWHALMINDGNGSLLHLTFSDGLGSPPEIDDLGNFGSLNKPFGLELVQKEDTIFALASNLGSGNVSIVRFGNSINNIPNNNDVNEVNIPSSSALFGVSMINEDNLWYGLISSDYGGGIYLVNFGEDIFNGGTVEQLSSLNRPTRVKLIKEGSEYYGFVSTRSQGIYRYSFGGSMNNSPVQSQLSQIPGYSTVFDFDMVYKDAIYQGLILDYSDQELTKITFDGDCNYVSTNYSIEENPVISYGSSGNFMITLTAFDEYGKKENKFDSIFVQNEIAPNISFETSNNCIANVNNFLGSSSNNNIINSWEWDFGDGNNATGQNSEHQYSLSGNFLTELRITTEDGCINRYSDTVKIFEFPQTDFSIPNSDVCTNDEIIFQNTSNNLNNEFVDFQWYMEGEAISNAIDLNTTFRNQGLKLIGLTMDIDGCLDSLGKSIEVRQGPDVSFTFTNNCFGDSIEFINNTTGSLITDYNWSFGDGKSSTKIAPKHLYLNEGEYEVTLEVTNSTGCSNLFKESVNVSNDPKADFNYSLDLIENFPIEFFGLDQTYENDSVIYWEWVFNEEDTLVGKNVEYVYTSSGEQEVILNVITDQSCQFELSKSITVQEPSKPYPNFEYPSENCKSENIEIVNTTVNGDTFQWDFCHNDLQSDLEYNLLGALDGVDGGNAIKLVNEAGIWYGFISSRNSHEIHRLEFDRNLQSINSNTNLGNIGGLLSRPNSIQFIKESDIWYGLIINDGNNHLLRLKFSNGLSSEPAVEDLGTYGSLSSPFGLELIRKEDSIFAIAANLGTDYLTIFNFGHSITSTPQAGNDVSEITIPSGSLFGISMIEDNSNWYGLLTSDDGGKIYRINFGEDILDGGEVEQISTLIRPTRAKLIKEGNEFFGLVSTRSQGLYKYSFGNTMVNTPEESSLSSIPGYSNVFDFDLVYNQTIYQGLVLDYADQELTKISFLGNCEYVSQNFSEMKNPEINYSVPGTYSIVLTAFDENENKDSILKEIDISNNSAPTLSFSTTNACVDNQNEFIATSPDETSITSWTWDFGDETSADIQNPSHQFDTAGVYPVQLSIDSDNGCSNTISKDIAIYSPPEPDFSFPSSIICTNSDITFTNQTEVFGADTLVSYLWNFNGEYSATAVDTTLNFENGGSKNITLSASIPGCTVDTTKVVNITNGPNVNFDYSGQCVTDEYDFTNLTTGENITNYLWDFGDGFSSNLQSPEHTFESGGGYNVTLTVSNASGCDNVYKDSLIVGYIPVADFDYELPCSNQEIQFFNTSSVEAANIVGFDWDVMSGTNGGGSSDQQDPMLMLPESGNSDVRLIVESTFGCMDTVTQTINILPSPAVDMIQELACLGDSSTFISNSTISSGSITSNTWFVGNDIYNSEELKLLFNNPGDYDVTLLSRADNLCNNSITETVSIASLPSVDFDFSNACEKTSIIFNGIVSSPEDPISEYTWSLDGQLLSYNESFSYRFDNPGQYEMNLMAMTENDCENELTRTIEIFPTPVADFTPEPPVGAPPLDVDFINESTGATEYLWDFSQNNDDTDDSENTFYTYNDLGEEYPVLIASNEYNCSDTATALIQILDPVYDLIIEDVIQTILDDKITFLVQVKNNGTVVVNNPELLVTLDQGYQVSETVDNLFLPGDEYNHELSFELRNIPTDNASNICFEVIDPNIGKSDNLSATACIAFGDKMQLIEPYPNPASGIVKIPLILPNDEAVLLNLLNSDGSVVKTIDFNTIQSGLNVISLDCNTIASGTYYLVVRSSGESQVKKLIVR